MAFSPNSQLLISASFDATARLWDLEKGEERYILKAYPDSVLNVAFSPDGTYMATASANRIVGLWDVSRQMKWKNHNQVSHLLLIYRFHSQSPCIADKATIVILRKDLAGPWGPDSLSGIVARSKQPNSRNPPSNAHLEDASLSPIKTRIGVLKQRIVKTYRLKLNAPGEPFALSLGERKQEAAVACWTQ